MGYKLEKLVTREEGNSLFFVNCLCVCLAFGVKVEFCGRHVFEEVHIVPVSILSGSHFDLPAHRGHQPHTRKLCE